MCNRTYTRKPIGLFLPYILIGVTPIYLVKILFVFFLLARLNLPFVAPGPISWLYTARDRQQGEILLYAASYYRRQKA